jgi:hypothetical protein
MSMSKEDGQQLIVWHAAQRNKVFHFRREMLDYCLQDVRVLTAAIQASYFADHKLMGFDGMAETCTVASKCNLFFRNRFLEVDSIGVIPHKGYSGHRNQSKEALLWLLYQERINFPGLIHAASTKGEKSILGIPVDGFHEATNTVLSYEGCF